MDCEELKDLSPEMMTTFKQLQSAIMTDYGPKEAEDEQIYRFLKARDFDFKKADNMLRNHIELRKQVKKQLETFKMDKLQESYIRVFVLTFTKEGYPLPYVHLGNKDYKGLLKSIKQENILLGLAIDIFHFEKCLEEESKKRNKRINKWSIILDLEGLPVSQILYKPTMELGLQVFSLYEANFPERLKFAVVINASPVFTMAFNVIKPLLSDVTMSKIKVFGKDGWKEELPKLIYEEDLPKFLGGKMTGPDGDPYCGIVQSGPISKEHYFRSPERRLRGKKDIKQHILKRGEKHDLSFNNVEVGNEIVWKFETETGDISFGVFYMEGDATKKTILPIKKVNSHAELEEGSYLCDKEGTYILTFDNTHSWLKQKCLYYKAYIQTANSEEIISTR